MTQCDEAIRRQLQKPIVFILVGYPGSGKTYYAKNTLMNNDLQMPPKFFFANLHSLQRS